MCRRRASTIVTCEHASRAVPAAYGPLFRGAQELLRSHRGYDVGARPLAKMLGAALNTTPFLGSATRLLVDLNRLPSHPACFSEVTASLSAVQKQAILERWHRPWRAAVRSRAAMLIESGVQVIHVSVHTFTPILDGCVRDADVGLLIDSRRDGELALVRAWRAQLLAICPELRIRRNYPYRGRADGMATWLRGQFDPRHYVGIELEVNQRFPIEGGSAWRRLKRGIAAAAREAVAHLA